MRVTFVLLSLVVAFAAGESLSRSTQGTKIGNYPFMAAMLRSATQSNYAHSCAGTILNNRSVLTAARCLYGDAPSRWRFRLGSSKHNTGGKVHTVTQIRIMTNFDDIAMMNDIAVVRTNTAITFGTNVRVGSFAGANYNLGNNQAVVSVGWGYTAFPSWNPAQHGDLRRHEQRTIAANTCTARYQPYGFYIRDATQVCSGFSNPGSISSSNARDKCLGEPGAPLIHGSTIVGVRSYALNCNNAATPVVSSRVGNFINWISSNT